MFFVFIGLFWFFAVDKVALGCGFVWVVDKLWFEKAVYRQNLVIAYFNEGW